MTILGVTAFGWAVACSSSNGGSSGTSGSATTGTSGSATTGSSGSATTGTSGSATTGTSGSATTGSSGTISDAGSTAGGVIIDNMLSSDGKIALSKGFSAGASGGFWYTFSDIVATETTLLTPPNGHWAYTTVTPPAGVTSTHAACLTALPWAGYAAGIGFNFAVIQSDADAGDAAPPAVPATYDATPYTGITFWAMSLPNAGADPTIKIAFPDDNTHGADPNATCHRTDAGAGQCDDDWSDLAEGLTATWAQISISFASLNQGGYGGAVGTFASWDGAHSWGVNIQVNGAGPSADGGPNNAAFGFCISDIQFTQ